MVSEEVREALLHVAEDIERELICCDAYEQHQGTEHIGTVRHQICFWAGAARAIVLEHIEDGKCDRHPL